MAPFGRFSFNSFLGSNSKIHHKRKFRYGSFLNIGENVVINANSRKGIVVGDYFTLRDFSKIDCQSTLNSRTEGLLVGNNVGISENAFIQVRGFVAIGNDVIVGPNFTLLSENHSFNNPSVPIRKQGVSRKGVTIEDDVWIGANVTILDGVTIKSRTVVAAGAVVNKSFAGNCILGGVPAKVIKLL